MNLKTNLDYLCKPWGDNLKKYFFYIFFSALKKEYLFKKKGKEMSLCSHGTIHIIYIPLHEDIIVNLFHTY